MKLLSKPTACPDCGDDLITVGPRYEMEIEGVRRRVQRYFCQGERMIWTFAAGEPVVREGADHINWLATVHAVTIRRIQEAGATVEGWPHFSEWSPELTTLSLEGKELLDREAAQESNGTEAT